MKRIALFLLVLTAPACALLALNRYRGANFISYGPKDDLKKAASFNSVYSLRDTGLNTVVIPVTWFQESVSATNIFPRTNSYWQTPSDDAVSRVIDYCRGLGLTAVIKLHLDVTNGDPRTWIVPSDFTAWGNQYRSMVMKYARMAAERGAGMLILGTELTGVSTNQYASYWRDLIQSVRTVYGGILCYSANWDSYEQIPFWQDLDIIGIDAYFPLLQGNIKDKGTIKGAWSFCRVPGTFYAKNWLAGLRNYSSLKGKNILFTEIGYRSFAADNASESVLAIPWAWNVTAGRVDMEIQAKAYAAFIDVFLKEDWFEGFFLWNWYPRSDAGGWNNSEFTPQNKPACEVLRSTALFEEDIRKEDLEIVSRPEKVDYVKNEPLLFVLQSHREGEVELKIFSGDYKKVYEKKERLADEEQKEILVPYSGMKGKISRGLYYYTIRFGDFESRGRFVIVK